jgi:predicted nucleic acid-binding protein
VTRSAALRERLNAADLVHVDARVFAYHLIAENPYAELTRVVFGGMQTGAVRAQTSSLALYQLLAEVYRRGEDDRAREIARMLTVHQGLDMVPVTPDVAMQAAQVRAQLGGRPERAVQIATALAAGAEIFLTQGSGLRRIVGMAVINLEDFA